MLVLGCDIPPTYGPMATGPRVLATDPVEGARDVDRGAMFLAFFDRQVMPHDVHRGNVYVASGERLSFLSPRFDPVDRVLIAENHGAPLVAGVCYRFGVSGLHDFDGFVMDEALEVVFDTGDDVSPPPMPPASSFADVAPIFERCVDFGCHAGPDPVLGLDLSSPEAVQRTAIGVLAEETRLGVEDEGPWHGAAILGGLSRIDVVGGVGRPAWSYLLYKVLGDPHVGGVRMPPEPAAPLSRVELRELSDWILSGAPTD